jgi:separase
VANLWDVTDRDIDRYCQALLRSWLGCVDPAAPAAGEEEEEAKQPVGWAGLGQAVAGSRGACRLPHLIGAAPVCYGLPLRK